MRKIYASYCLINSVALCESFSAETSKGKEKTPSIYLCIYLMGSSPVINFIK